jgi:hypothetical protein
VGVVPAADRVPDGHLVAAVDGALAGSGHVARGISTHVDRTGPVAVTAVALELVPADPAPAVLDALAAALGGPVADDGPAPAQARERSDGRRVRFGGQEGVTGDHSAGELVATTDVDEVVGVGRAVGPDDVVATAGFVRPRFEGGRTVLLVEPVAGGRFRPVEVESPHQCCGGAH